MRRLILKLKAKTSTGLDGLSNKLLKNIFEAIKPQLLIIINNCEVIK